MVLSCHMLSVSSMGRMKGYCLLRKVPVRGKKCPWSHSPVYGSRINFVASWLLQHWVSKPQGCYNLRWIEMGNGSENLSSTFHFPKFEATHFKIGIVLYTLSYKFDHITTLSKLVICDFTDHGSFTWTKLREREFCFDTTDRNRK